MQKPPSKSPKSSFAKYLMAGSGLAMLVVSGAAYAQEAAPVKAGAEDIETVVVVGARAAQQSANERKKRAKTATDSIVADDVDAFPDKNLNEALSRIPGVGLARDEFGDGASISIRGNTNENIRVELDGLGVQGGGMGATRAADLVSLPSDLIKSVDVVKGSTADMTEGSLGGSVRVQTRTGLDFKKPYVSLRIGARRNSLGQRWEPDYNLIASRKFLDGRLGVVLSVTQTMLQNTTNGMENNQFRSGYQGRIDFDNSPEKTFSFNPATVYSPPGEVRPTFGADTRLANSSFTPREIVQKSADAQTKAQCLAAFPIITPGTGAGQSNTAAIRNQRNFELQTCLGQWNDLEPSLPRNFDHSQDEDRFSADIRFDFRVNDHLTVFAKYNKTDRRVDRNFRERRLGGGLSTGANPGVQYNATTNPRGVWYIQGTGENQQRLVAPGNTQYFRYEAINTFGNSTINGEILPIDPKTVKVDANHFVTEYVMNDQTMFVGQRWEPFSFDTSFVQAGGTYRNGDLRIEFLAGKAQTEYIRQGTNSTRSFNYGSARFFQQPSGLFAYEFLNPIDATNPANYVQMNVQGATARVDGAYDIPYAPAYTVADLPRVSGTLAVEYDPSLSETAETTAKIDVTYNVAKKIPFFTSLKTGVNYRNPEGSFWDRPGGRTIRSAQGEYFQRVGGVASGAIIRDASGRPLLNPNYVPAIVLPRTIVRSGIRACEPTATSTVSCNYGQVPDTLLFERRDSLLTLTPQQLIQLVGSTFTRPESDFFNGYPGAEALTNWQGVNTQAIVGLMPNMNLDCIKTCVASDGKVYEQPYNRYSEKITAAYYVAEFEQNLPFGLMVDGNFGLRMVQTEVEGTGTLTLVYNKLTAAFNPADPNNTAGYSSITYTQNASISRTTRDYLPSYNVNLWVIPDQLVVRYYKGKNVARPAVGDLLPASTCTIDERRTLGLDEFGEENGCNRIGNPALKAFTAWNQNLSIEWYPNRDTTIGISAFEQDERIGRRIGITETGNLLAGSGLTDPTTGQSVDDILFSYPTWGNAPGFLREGWEFTSKTAFTFLPWKLRYTGADFNYSKQTSTAIGAATSFMVNPNTGEVMPPQASPSYAANLSLWYDDGKTNARISWQARDETFDDIEGNAGNVRNNYPFAGGINSRPTPYRPGNPMFTDKTLFVDAKITHKLRPNVEVFAEARNVTKEARMTWDGGNITFADGSPYINGIFYGGRHFSFGVTYRMGN